MSFEEISKKDLLQMTGISYGQLYRWKRQGLIPEEWFIKKASFTGQETYFPKDLVLERIDQILELKDEKSLEEIADIIHNKSIVKDIYTADLLNYEILIHPEVLEIVNQISLSFEEIVLLKIMDNIYPMKNNLNQLKDCLESLKQYTKELMSNTYPILYFFIKDDGIGYLSLKEAVEIEYQLPPIIKVNIKLIIENLKIVLFK
jgi:DNA-binding transcriptional MerR regulator